MIWDTRAGTMHGSAQNGALTAQKKSPEKVSAQRAQATGGKVRVVETPVLSAVLACPQRAGRAAQREAVPGLVHIKRMPVHKVVDWSFR